MNTYTEAQGVQTNSGVRVVDKLTWTPLVQPPTLESLAGDIENILPASGEVRRPKRSRAHRAAVRKAAKAAARQRKPKTADWANRLADDLSEATD